MALSSNKKAKIGIKLGSLAGVVVLAKATSKIITNDVVRANPVASVVVLTLTAVATTVIASKVEKDLNNYVDAVYPE